MGLLHASLVIIQIVTIIFKTETGFSISLKPWAYLLGSSMVKPQMNA